MDPGASIISSWNTDVDLGLVADSLTNVDAGTSDHVIWLSASSGNVGIGTTTPSQALEVSDSSSGNIGITVSNIGSGNPQLRFTDVAGSETVALTYIKDWDSGSKHGFALWDGTENVLNMRDGNIGIGTTTPNSNLDVSGYIELDTSSGLPSTADCDNADKVGRMKVDDSSLTLYVCAYDGSTHAWMTINGHSSIVTSSPVIISLVADDLDNLDTVYSIDDTITITFDSDTNTPGGTGVQSSASVKNMFTFTEPLGQIYRGQWTVADTFTITIKNTNNAGPPVIGTTTVTPAGTIPILSYDGTSTTITSPPLSGDFGQ